MKKDLNIDIQYVDRLHRGISEFDTMIPVADFQLLG